MGKNKLFFLIGIFWIIIIIVFIATKEFTLQTGKQVLLKTVPVDPRDLFRGDYVILRYEISNLDLTKISSDYSDFKSRDKICVTLKEENGYGVPVKIYKNSPTNERLFLRGTVRDVHGNGLTVEYGIESYFVPEGKGREIEKIREGKKIDAKVSIDKFGNTVIRSLLTDGKEISIK